MTMLTRSAQPWMVQPGWGIHVDLTPPELLTSRQLRLVRKMVVWALATVVVLCAAGWFVASRARSSAEDELANVQLATSQLQQQAHKYAGVTQIKGAVGDVNTQIASLMTGDVAIDTLVNTIGSRLPADVVIKQLTVTISPAGVAGSQTGTTGSTIDNSGHARVGTVALSGTAGTLDEVSRYVDRLARITGVLDVVPTSNANSDRGVQYNITLGLDDRLLSHRFDVKGGK